MGSPGVAMSLGRVGGWTGLAGKLGRRELRRVLRVWRWFKLNGFDVLGVSGVI
jgi:hypothetical protein